MAPSLPQGGTTATQPAEVVQGTVERVVFANGESGWTVLRLLLPGQRDTVTAVGSLLGVQPGERLRLSGRWVEDAKYGRQFRA
jgi:exodeoxyribonuclease V alpha subunit